jgi:hypothetical protein
VDARRKDMARPGRQGPFVRFDREFLQALEKDPAGVLKQYGIEATPDIIDAIREMDFGPLYKIAEAFPTAAPPERPAIGVRPLIGVEPAIGKEKPEDQVGLIFP